MGKTLVFPIPFSAFEAFASGGQRELFVKSSLWKPLKTFCKHLWSNVYSCIKFSQKNILYKGGIEMENVIDLTERDMPFSEEITEIAAETEANEKTEAPREHFSEQTRGGMRILLSIAALFGAAAGAIAAVTGNADSRAVIGLSARISGNFGEIFLHRALSGGAIVLIEFLLGFFAFGDFISWIFPIFAGLGAGFFIAGVQNPVFLPSEAAVLFAVIFAGADSAIFSRKLFGLASGNRAFFRGMSAKEYSARFAFLFLSIVAAALYEGIAAVNFVS